MKMTGSRFLLDTNIIIGWLKGETSIADKISKAKEIHIPIVVIGELYYGALYSGLVKDNIKRIQTIIDNYSIPLIDVETSLAYANIKTALRKKGKPIPENDIWIAAIAQRHQLTIVTRDKHFNEIENVGLKNW